MATNPLKQLCKKTIKAQPGVRLVKTKKRRVRLASTLAPWIQMEMPKPIDVPTCRLDSEVIGCEFLVTGTSRTVSEFVLSAHAGARLGVYEAAGHWASIQCLHHGSCSFVIPVR